jgi:hypothetical protein
VKIAIAATMTSIGTVHPPDSWCRKPVSGAELAAIT